MGIRIDWIPDPTEWEPVSKLDDHASNLETAISRATGVQLCNAGEVKLLPEHIDFFRGAAVAGMYGAKTLVDALQKHGSIRVRYIRT